MTNRSDSLAFQRHDADVPPAAQARRWELRRNCALTPHQLVLALGVLCLPCLLIGLAFWSLGVPWVAPFAGLEALAVAAALVAYARHARDGEWILVDGEQLVWQSTCGQSVENGRADMRGLRVVQGRERGAAVKLAFHGRHIEFGRHAAPAVRDRFAEEFTQALKQAAPRGAGGRI